MKTVLAILTILLCSGCMSTGGKIKRLQVGAPKFFVLGKLGGYDGYERVGDQEIYMYANKKKHGLSPVSKTNYYVAFRDGRLSASGVTDKVPKPKTGSGSTLLFFDLNQTK